MIDKLTNALRALGATKVKSIKERDCVLLVVEVGNDVFLLSLSKGRFTGSYVIKLAPSDKVGGWSCIDVEYSPYGLYVLGSEEDEVLGRVITKFKMLLSAGPRVT